MRLLFHALLVAVALAGCATAPSGDRDRAQILALQERWAAARVAQDADFLEQFYTPDFRVFALDGDAVTRAEDIQNFRSKALKPDLIEDEDLDVRVMGEVALVTGIERLRGSYRGNPGAFVICFTNVYVRDQGRWRLAHHHSTEIRNAK